jgi:hypothetical protein
MFNHPRLREDGRRVVEGEGEGMVVSFMALGRSFAPITPEDATAGCKVVGMATEEEEEEEEEEGRAAATMVEELMAATVVEAFMAAAAVVVLAAATPPALTSVDDMGLARVALGFTQDA